MFIYKFGSNGIEYGYIWTTSISGTGEQRDKCMGNALEMHGKCIEMKCMENGQKWPKTKNTFCISP